MLQNESITDSVLVFNLKLRLQCRFWSAYCNRDRGIWIVENPGFSMKNYLNAR